MASHSHLVIQADSKTAELARFLASGEDVSMRHATRGNRPSQRLPVASGNGHAFRVRSRRAEKAASGNGRLRIDFFDRAPIGLLWVGSKGGILRLNKAQRDLLGYTRGQMVGRHISELCADPEAAADMLRRLFRSETLQNYRTRLRCRDGSKRQVIIDARVLSKNGHGVHSCWFVRDITRRLKLEKEILDTSEQVQRRIGQDLHDDLCQQLAGIEFLSQRLARQLAGTSKSGASRAREIARIALEAMNYTRALSHGLTPVRLEADGLMVALRELGSGTKRIFGIDCRFRCDGAVLIHDSTMSIHLYRIAQEAVSNAVKHGKARRIDIHLRNTGDRIVLSVRDHGKGMRARTRLPKGMGLQIMQYRADVIGGTLAMEPAANGGTCVTCTVRNGLFRA